jgi:hypothetical protein
MIDDDGMHTHTRNERPDDRLDITVQKSMGPPLSYTGLACSALLLLYITDTHIYRTHYTSTMIR